MKEYDERAGVLRNPETILKLKNPPEELVIEALMRNGLLIEHIKNPTELMQLAAYGNNPEAAMHINNPCPAILLNIMYDHGARPMGDIETPKGRPVLEERRVSTPSRMSVSHNFNSRFID